LCLRPGDKNRASPTYIFVVDKNSTWTAVHISYPWSLWYSIFGSLHKAIMSLPSYKLFCLGNPLLDIQVVNGEELLKKYDLKANDAILAEEKHLPMYDEIIRSYKVTYVAGGASQNTARGAAVSNIVLSLNRV
jgi:hypothetical protein